LHVNKRNQQINKPYALTMICCGVILYPLPQYLSFFFS